MQKRGLKFLSPDNVLAPQQAASSAWRIAMAKSWAQGAVDPWMTADCSAGIARATCTLERANDRKAS
jgi:hypothetical protein